MIFGKEDTNLLYIYISQLAIFRRFSQLSSGMGNQISQENSPNLQDQDFITIVITKEPSLMFFLSKTKTFVIMDVLFLIQASTFLSFLVP